MGQPQSTSYQYGTFIGTNRPSETPILRHPKYSTAPLKKVPSEGVDTLWKLFLYSVQHYPKCPFLGMRERLSKDTYGEYKYKTYSEIYDEVIIYGTGLVLLDLTPEVTTKSGDKFRFLGIYSRNREEWMISDIASHMNSVSIVTFYDTLGDATIEFILSETNLTSIVLETRGLQKLLNLRKNNKHHKLQNLILLDDDLPDLIEQAKQIGFTLYTFNDVLAKGKGNKVEFNYCTPETLATLSYTSGTTGTPKGTMLTHGQMAAEVTALENVGIILNSSDMYLSYLPLAHSFERVINCLCMFIGATVAFYSGSINRLVEDAQKCQTTVFIGVPRVFMRIYDKIVDTVKRSSTISKILFERAVRDKIANLRSTGKVTHPIYDRVVFRKVRNSLGGRCRLLVDGGAPITYDVVEFLKITLSVPFIMGYGATECCGAAIVSYSDETDAGVTGGPIPSVEMKLVDVPELNYTTKDVNEKGEWEPRGEILLRGPVVFQKYLNDEKNTIKAFSEDGWLRTGDIGVVMSGHGNAVKIIDRVKSIFKLSQGEYIAPEKVENLLMKSEYVSQIFITGNSTKNYAIAVVVPQREKIVEFLNEKRIKCEKEKVSEYYGDKEVIEEIVRNLDKVGRANDLKGFEIPKKIVLSKDVFSIENNLLTPTMKLKRFELQKRFKKELEQLYL